MEISGLSEKQFHKSKTTPQIQFYYKESENLIVKNAFKVQSAHKMFFIAKAKRHYYHEEI